MRGKKIGRKNRRKKSEKKIKINLYIPLETHFTYFNFFYIKIK